MFFSWKNKNKITIQRTTFFVIEIDSFELYFASEMAGNLLKWSNKFLTFDDWGGETLIKKSWNMWKKNNYSLD